MKNCTKCGRYKSLDMFYRASNSDKPRSECKECTDAYNKVYANAKKDKVNSIKRNYVARHPDRAKKSAENYRKKNPGVKNSHTANRRAAKLQRTPEWLTTQNKTEIKDFYAQAKELSKIFTIPFEVDHIVPLQGKNVSGLHVPWNLQILTQKENARKHNKA